MSNKIRVYDVFDSMHPADGFDSIIAALEKAKQAEASDEWKDLHLDDDYEDYDRRYASSKWIIRGYRWETDKEYEKRMKEFEKAAVVAKKIKAEKEQNEKKLYEKLKKKYEGK